MKIRKVTSWVLRIHGMVTLPGTPGLGFTPKPGILDLAVD